VPGTRPKPAASAKVVPRLITQQGVAYRNHAVEDEAFPCSFVVLSGCLSGAGAVCWAAASSRSSLNPKTKAKNQRLLPGTSLRAHARFSEQLVDRNLTGICLNGNYLSVDTAYRWWRNPAGREPLSELYSLVYGQSLPQEIVIISLRPVIRTEDCSLMRSPSFASGHSPSGKSLSRNSRIGVEPKVSPIQHKWPEFVLSPRLFSDLLKCAQPAESHPPRRCSEQTSGNSQRFVEHLLCC
jgi:hypothetical protein